MFPASAPSAFIRHYTVVGLLNTHNSSLARLGRRMMCWPARGLVTNDEWTPHFLNLIQHHRHQSCPQRLMTDLKKQTTCTMKPAMRDQPVMGDRLLVAVVLFGIVCLTYILHLFMSLQRSLLLKNPRFRRRLHEYEWYAWIYVTNYCHNI